MSNFSVMQIADALGATVVGNTSIQISGINEPSRASGTELALAMSEQFASVLSEGQAKAAVLWEGADWESLGLEAAIFAARPRYLLSGLTQIFDKPLVTEHGIHPTAIIDVSADIYKDALIGPYCVISSDVQIGPGAVLMSHVSVGSRTCIKSNARIHAGVRIGVDVSIGDNFIAQPNAVIGSDGFSFVTPTAGNIEEAKSSGKVTVHENHSGFTRINSLGGVEIGNNVEIGANASIDQGTIVATRIGNGTKLDNQVHVGHNVVVGNNCLLCGQVGVAGSSQIGDRVVLGGQVGVADHVIIGSDVLVAGKSGVSSNIPSGRVMMGNPAMKMEQNVESYKAIRRLPRFMKKIEARLNE